jgi:hypothetical protein
MLGFNVCRDFFFAYAAVTLLPVATERNERPQKRRDGFFVIFRPLRLTSNALSGGSTRPPTPLTLAPAEGQHKKMFLLFPRDNTRPIRLGQVNASRISAKSNVTTSEGEE